ncbi:MAG: pirin family protein [Melioribacteraceae bacterium]|nr:MAG: pirin family protein [Melioribacteraceae bacterium]
MKGKVMSRIIRSEERGHRDYGWLNTYHSFSFSDYYDPKKMNFGPLRVLNHDIVEAGKGFPTHPHKDMEIVTVIIKGELAHSDSMGKSEVIREYEVQKMSAGTGVYHSEFNNSPDKLVELMQIWIIPDRTGLQPSYEQIKFSPEQRKNKLLKIAGNSGNEGEIFISQKSEIYLSDLEKGKSLNFKPAENFGTYIYLYEGEIEVNGEKLNKGDAIQFEDTNELNIAAISNSSFILFEVALK